MRFSGCWIFNCSFLIPNVEYCVLTHKRWHLFVLYSFNLSCRKFYLLQGFKKKTIFRFFFGRNTCTFTYRIFSILSNIRFYIVHTFQAHVITHVVMLCLVLPIAIKFPMTFRFTPSKAQYFQICSEIGEKK